MCDIPVCCSSSRALAPLAVSSKQLTTLLYVKVQRFAPAAAMSIKMPQIVYPRGSLQLCSFLFLEVQVTGLAEEWGRRGLLLLIAQRKLKQRKAHALGWQRRSRGMRARRWRLGDRSWADGGGGGGGAGERTQRGVVSTAVRTESVWERRGECVGANVGAGRRQASAAVSSRKAKA